MYACGKGSPPPGLWARCLAAAAILAVTGPAFAHHSSAMFDQQQSVTLSGTVKQFQWSNPHCWIQIVIAGKTGVEEWSVEMGSPSQLYRGGWRPTTLRTGELVVLIVHPMRDGTKGGLFTSATRADGAPLGVSAQ
jgi:Family of unknown function (DUF6152)